MTTTNTNTEITFEAFLKELLALGSSGAGARDWFDRTRARDWFDRAREIGFNEEDTARFLAELCREDELANLGE